MMAEGFQSWSHSREMHKYNTLPPIQPMVAWITEFDLQGDYNFYNYSGKPGYIHSNSYTYLRHEDQLLFLGSVSEDSGYTYFKADFHHNLFSIYKDIDGKKLSRDDTLVIKIWITAQPTSHIRSVWETYASYYPSQTPRRELAGYSSWYDNYERITEEEVTRTLTAFKEHQYPIDVFQIDDGYQMQIGDWLHVNEKKFPRGMQQLAQTIADAGYLPGLWLAPFAVGINSKIVSEHSHWLITEPDGRFMKAGPNWGGFYALDIYHPEVETYLQDVLDVVIDTWGYRLLKLDFLFAAAMRPRNGKSRGEIMWDAMALIDKLVRKRALLLGSGVPLAYAWGRMDYCRVSSDVSPWWDHTILRFAHVRERVATANALPSTLSRWPMVAMFGNDPDVFFIRSTNNKLTAHERYTTVALNHAFGQITLMSDNVQLYTAEEHQLYASTFPK
ncbi:glycoside hydrolase superfamily, partial [Radiomyces spectabilis]|uniref:glycoside hydrolase superfamily n=1 Tax=Radiomyces spectabilis TaxID=64574 RepID=UPI00221F3E46